MEETRRKGSNSGRMDMALSPLMDNGQQATESYSTGQNRSSMHQDDPNSTPIFVYSLSVFAAVGGFLFGYDTGVVSGAMLLLKPAFALNSQWQELVVSITVAAAAIFALIGGYTTEAFGRRPVIFAASFIFAVGSAVLGFAVHRTMLVVGRFIVGAGVGLASMAVPMYIAEAAPPHMRGKLVTMNSLFITGGQFVAALLDGAFSYVGPDGWRYMLGLAAVPAVIQFFGFCFMPESPRWLIEKGEYEEARQVLYRIRGSKRIAEEEFKIVKETFEEDEKERQEKGGKFVLLTMLKTANLRRALIVGCACQMFQQLAGINTVMYYSATIIRMAGVKSTQLAIWLASVTAGVNFIFTFVGFYCVERIGRRLLTLGSQFFVTLSLLVLAIGFNLMSSESPSITPSISQSYSIPGYEDCWSAVTCDTCVSHHHCGYCFNENGRTDTGACLPASIEDSELSLTGPCGNATQYESTWAYDWCPTRYAWLTILGLILYLVAFAPGMGPMPWTINSEIYPQWARSTGNAMATATCWIFNLLISITYLTLMDSITKHGTYYLYTSISLIGLIFFYLFLPETKGKTLEQLEHIFTKPWFTSGNEGRGCFGPGVIATCPHFGTRRSRKSRQTSICDNPN